MMTLETENKDECCKPREKLGIIQISQPPRHPKQYRKASMTKPISPSTSFNSIVSKSFTPLCVSQELTPTFLENANELFLTFPSLGRKKSIVPDSGTNSPISGSFQSFTIPSPKKEIPTQNLTPKFAAVLLRQSPVSEINSLDFFSQPDDSASKNKCPPFYSSLNKDCSKDSNSFDLELITPLLSDNETTPDSLKSLFGSIDDNHGIPVIPPPPESRGRSPSRLPLKGTLDLLDLSSEDEKSTSSTQTISTLPSVISPTVTCTNELLLNTASASTSMAILPSTDSNAPSKNNELNAAASLSAEKDTSVKILQARLSLTGLSPQFLSSEEFSKKSTAPYTPLATPDLKIDLLDPDPRRPSLTNRFSPPLIPPGFPCITPDDLTPEELHDFDMKWGSPHHARGKMTLSRPTLLALPGTRPRVTSLPNRREERDEDDDDCYRLRHFSITGRGVVNRGDSFRSRRSKSNNSVASDVSSNEGWAWSHPCSLVTSAASSAASSRASSTSDCAFPFRVVMLGAAGVGKTTLCHQFMTSEHINGYDSSLDDEYGEKSVSIMLDGDESEIQLIDHPADEMSVENYLATYNPHAIVVVFSVVDRQSFVRAEEIIQYLWRLDVMSHKGVILVANKTDLVRSRCIPLKESSNLADSYDCKFIETSSGLNHRVDELLVGVVKQIRLKIHNPDLSREVFRKRSSRRKKYRGAKTSASLKVKSLLTKVCGKEIKSKSCENLHVL